MASEVLDARANIRLSSATYGAFVRAAKVLGVREMELMRVVLDGAAPQFAELADEMERAGSPTAALAAIPAMVKRLQRQGDAFIAEAESVRSQASS